ncbi:MAG: hypothetical protein RR623_01210 [Bacilli bacterium]
MIWYILLLLGIITVCVIINLNSGKDEEYVSDEDLGEAFLKEHVSDEELREAFLKEYINYSDCAWIKLNSLPKSFKIGNVYFNKCVEDGCYYLEFLSYVLVDDKIYNNGSLSIDFKFSFNTTNKDLIDYILNNLDKVEEVKQ